MTFWTKEKGGGGHSRGEGYSNQRRTFIEEAIRVGVYNSDSRGDTKWRLGNCSRSLPTTNFGEWQMLSTLTSRKTIYDNTYDFLGAG
jgi:hypothetical protein